jgi:hypothetical protein
MTEYGLRLAKKVSEKAKKVAPYKSISHKRIENIIRCSNSVWDHCAADEAVHSTKMLPVSFYSLLDDLGVKVPDNVVVLPDIEDVWLAFLCTCASEL